MKGLQDEGAGGQLIYMDETTFLCWPRPSKTWMRPDEEVAAPQNKKRLSSVTLYGAIGKSLTAP